MNYFKKSISLFLIILLVLSVFSGCSNNNDANDKTNDSNQNSNSKSNNTTKENSNKNDDVDSKNSNNPDTYISDEPLTLTIHMHYQNQNPYSSDLPVFKKAEELTNIKLENVASDSSADSTETYNLMIAAGDLPDIITLPFIGKTELYVKDAIDGVYMGLQDLISQYAPNIKKVFEEHNDISNYLKVNNEDLYAIPFFYDVNAKEGMGWFIRNDWLESLNLESPKNVEEYYNVLKAFRENDPNNNGEKDEVPFFSRAKSPSALYILWNAYHSFHVEDSKIKYGPLDDNYKEAIRNVSKWYDEGLIDPEIFTAGSAAREKLLTQDMGGSTFDWFASTSSYNERNEETSPNFEFSVIAPPAGNDQVIRNNFARPKIVPGVLGWAISSTNKHPEETMKYFDFWFSEAGKMLNNFGLEGEDYTIVNEDPIFTDNVMKADVPPINYLMNRGAQIIGMGTMQDIRYEINVMHPIGKAGYDLYSSNNWRVETFPLISYSENQNKIANPILANVNTYVSEMEQKWILGTSSIEDDFDEFVNTLKDFGIDKVISIQQEIYDSLN